MKHAAEAFFYAVLVLAVVHCHENQDNWEYEMQMKKLECKP